MLEYNVLEFKYGRNIIKLENGFIARQSTSSVLASMDDTVVIATIVCNDEPNFDQKFLPLTVNYQEKFYSIGKIPGSFFRREGRSSDIEIIISRLIDRSVRPLFKKNFLNDIQIIVNVISVNPQINTDIISIIAVSAALNISGIPGIKTLGVARIGYINNNYILNPSLSEINLSLLNLIVVGTKDYIFMIDSSSNNLHERFIIDGINFAYDNFKSIIDNINIFTEKNKNIYFSNFSNINFNYLYEDFSDDINNYIYNYCIKDIKEIYFNNLNKKNRNNNLKLIENNLIIELNKKNIFKNYLIKNKIFKLEKEIIIKKLLDFNLRIDGRYENDIRDIDIKVGFLPKRVHGSSLFTRGETQALVTVTLGTSRDAQIFNDVFLGERLDNFIFHYNFPPYSVGEIGNIGIPKRREIGHGYLAKKGILPILPCIKKFPYTLRIVSDILESNGSSSMASVCGASLALMDAGVPIKNHVSGIAMGLIKTNNKNIILSDIIGDEDRLGDMDFKIIGTYKGINALQMDMKINNITYEDVIFSLKKSNYARFFILDKMNSFINKPNKYLSFYAPKIYKFKININKIKNIIGKGGSVIKSLTEKNNCLIEVNNDGFISIISNNQKNINNVVNDIKEIINNIRLGSVYLGKIIKIVSFGLFVSFLKNKEGLVHISKIYLKNRNKNIFDYFKVGQHIYVKVLNIDNNKRIKLSIKKKYK